ncbi:MAG: hypothetical protein P8H23_01375 [Flavobacteriaceae bacterium]|nr:hypothetical protein [Flavobacteriaceae bacterium]
MKNSRNTGKKAAAIVLFAILTFPSIFNFIHHFGEHTHIECSENKSHIHQSVSGCDICDFNLLSFNYHISDYADLEPSEIPVELNIIFEPLQLHAFTLTNTQLRAPPFFS